MLDGDKFDFSRLETRGQVSTIIRGLETGKNRSKMPPEIAR